MPDSFWYCTDCNRVESQSDNPRQFEMKSCSECGRHMVLRPFHRIPDSAMEEHNDVE